MNPGLRHDALLYRTQEELIAAVAPFAAEGIRQGEHVVAVVAEHHVQPLRAALDDALDGRDGVEIFEAHRWYLRPVQTIAGYADVLARQAVARRRVRVVGEVDFGTHPIEQRDWVRYEAALNAVFADRDAWIVCPYDVERLPAEVLAGAHRTHPRLWRNDVVGSSEAYQPPERVLRGAQGDPLPESARLVLSLRLTRELAALRAALRAAALSCGLERDRVRDFVLALNEVITNALVHGRGDGTIRVWRHEHGLLGEVSDQGPGLPDPLVGYQPPDGPSEGGVGLWLARQLADTLEFVPSSTGTTVRIGVFAETSTYDGGTHQPSVHA